ncbi:peptidase [Enterococcus saigonensis]|uniref:Peptidase n=1 Tax=Enterococcus saigonensis TaxID=1805431 RepID=A0A679IMH3_9ENTE|nr:PepSY domain-containing protein [Enterococcus saigonensis]BCA86486.1 peptidase [Enterococcus saigonensis]
MNNENEFSYFKGGLALGMSVGLVGGMASAFWLQQKRTLRADNVLHIVKEEFLKEGPIEGSWINFEKQPLRKFAIHSEGYEGGITRLEDDQLVTYEFLADAKTGTVLDVKRVKISE